MDCLQHGSCTRSKVCEGLGVCFWSATHIKPEAEQKFEDELALFIHKWLLVGDLDNMIEGLDTMILALETRRDVEVAKKT